MFWLFFFRNALSGMDQRSVSCAEGARGCAKFYLSDAVNRAARATSEAFFSL